MGEEGKWLNHIRIIMDEAAVKVSTTQEYVDIL
jgi:hypothetical protein